MKKNTTQSREVPNSNQDKFMRVVTALTISKYWNPDATQVAKACGVSYNYTRATIKKLRDNGKIDHQIGVRLQ